MLDTAEISVTIIAASIPALRILFREIKSSAARRYYVQTGGSKKNPLGRQDSQEASRGTVKSHSIEKDDESDRKILGLDAATGKDLPALIKSMSSYQAGETRKLTRWRQGTWSDLSALHAPYLPNNIRQISSSC
ncbi:hypothetical protein B0H67DRAFT_321654 [Lasiosphaeris hirsuta]|uniref:Uncharacterized protein n=1 Tax=Lasiosphaeris hirsuta TaxID=260670 RepID=A0AA40A1X9_9PEZI|nr:hypothetical protein B0H67DRAFT_321654 [Lasiosphaeris hirsuta]